MNSLPGKLSGSDDLDGSMAHNSSYTSPDLNTTLVISVELLDGRSLRRRLLILDVISLVNTDEKNVLSALAFSRADDRILLLYYYLDGVCQEWNDGLLWCS